MLRLALVRSPAGSMPLAYTTATRQATATCSPCLVRSVAGRPRLVSVSPVYTYSSSTPSSSLSPSLSSTPFSRPQARSKMTLAPSDNARPAMSISTSQPVAIPSSPSSTSESANSLSASSPAFSRSHPFLRKFQTTVNKVIAQQKAQPAAAAGASAFSTSAPSFGPVDDSSNSDGQRGIDEAPAQVTARITRTRSPTTKAAQATDAILNKRLSNYKSEDHEDHEHHHGPGCGCGSSSPVPSIRDLEMIYGAGYEDDICVNPAHFPPVSAEAREFSDRLLGQNKAWAIKTEKERPGFFARLEEQQKPQVLWIGCSDSRVPANQIVNLDPGEIFVHRNIANVVTHTDMNLLSVLEYAVEVLKVRHIIICGHYGCGGVAASLTQKQFGIIDNWLRNIKDLYTIHRSKFDTLPAGGKEQKDLLTELNVIQSALNVCHTSIIQRAWSRGEKLSVHGWCYRLSDGVIRNLGLCIEGPGNVEEVYHVIDEVKANH
ncbi:hypothetical protein BGW38_001776 [Lunasporangiospora selenospora]|uniref:Carbonic anhydrase n=1 Tax=Lunasporangiospora selenospora TaxID=979761 RepID=A0A9P6FV46_9FUNG|nr:hypothetical protein BGW38_001776 [Lunasporangiospora selenospora]